MLRNFLAIFSLALGLAACQTRGVILRDTPLGISETRKAIVAVAGEPRSISQNGRELLSKYYDRDGRFIAKMDRATERFYTHFIILGDRRPYDIKVQVSRELRENGDFTFYELDEDRAYSIAEKLEKTLIESRDKRNLLDDFRSF